MEESGLQHLADTLRLFKNGEDPRFESAAAQPVALIVPSTKEIVGEATGLRDLGLIQLVGGIEMLGLQRPTDIISLLRTGPLRPDLIILSDQILSPADASVLVRTDGEDRYFSPIEAILNLKYGYRLAIWSSTEYVDVEPYTPAMSIVFQKLATYLHDCEGLGGRWDMRELQKLRLPTERRRLALRKIRHFRSAVLNAYRDSPNDLDGLVLLHKADTLEQQLTEQVDV